VNSGAAQPGGAIDSLHGHGNRAPAQRHGRTFTAEFKADIVQRCRRGLFAALAEDMDVEIQS